MQIENIKHHLDAIDTLSEAQFELWGPLTGRNTLEEYRKLLHFAAESESLPTTLVAVENATVLGSVNVLENDLPLRPDIAPWLAQLFVFPNFRRRSAGALLIAGAIAEARKLNRSSFCTHRERFRIITRNSDGLVWKRSRTWASAE